MQLRSRQNTKLIEMIWKKTLQQIDCKSISHSQRYNKPRKVSDMIHIQSRLDPDEIQIRSRLDPD